mmetsp:Transcript_68175/g.154240  ORF Transcript_68175/g.154240 Transcript_68175/m.154240 type:complete len:194 (-) Transcript_68175:180-761(-)|eukprot:CAMPEP_0172626124 /NCGR_PEP_ID=MMETSP1068-20121228/148183_1 /TAXON_ID=35684 /ORGANISM="Pseudopedinella elastica, Strain CCMP716" /LENGTH=193 /DNA_ID=CAMNT_0013435653 /DNA_START=51 /DNA_END=632 /DNA_ORIENTATION=-
MAAHAILLATVLFGCADALRISLPRAHPLLQATSSKTASTYRTEAPHMMPATVSPARTKEKRRTSTAPSEELGRRGGPLEYLVDETASRLDDDPFHIMLLESTFQRSRITVGYVASQLVYTLDMPERAAEEHAEFAKSEGASCLGTWPRGECMRLGAKLQVRDLVVRVVPGVEGGGRPWQAKRAEGGGSEIAP